MILTGTAIRQARRLGEIVLEPFDDSLVNPNSYNYRLGTTLVRISRDAGGQETVDCLELAADGLLLQPKILYLGYTYEVIGSTKYVMTLLGRSSIGRLGLFLNVTADLGHVGSASQWTLELKVVQPLRVYPYMRIGQVAFWLQCGRVSFYQGRYHHDAGPVRNRDPRLERC